MDIKNSIRKEVWRRQPQNFKQQAIINVDGTISPTTGECKEGMDISYDGQWSYNPLVVSLANTREPLFIVNRSGNVVSHSGSPAWIDKSLDLVADIFEKVYVRGDTDFSLTGHLDRWDQRCSFVFGMDARKNLVPGFGLQQKTEAHVQFFQHTQKNRICITLLYRAADCSTHPRAHLNPNRKETAKFINIKSGEKNQKSGDWYVQNFYY
jgi:hypothetical protein